MPLGIEVGEVVLVELLELNLLRSLDCKLGLQRSMLWRLLPLLWSQSEKLVLIQIAFPHFGLYYKHSLSPIQPMHHHPVICGQHVMLFVPQYHNLACIHKPRLPLSHGFGQICQSG